MGGDSKTQPLIAEVRPLEVKQDNQENVNLTDAVSAVKKVSGWQNILSIKVGLQNFPLPIG